MRIDSSSNEFFSAVHKISQYFFFNRRSRYPPSFLRHHVEASLSSEPNLLLGWDKKNLRGSPRRRPCFVNVCLSELSRILSRGFFLRETGLCSRPAVSTHAANMVGRNRHGSHFVGNRSRIVKHEPEPNNLGLLTRTHPSMRTVRHKRSFQPLRIVMVLCGFVCFGSGSPAQITLQERLCFVHFNTPTCLHSASANMPSCRRAIAGKSLTWMPPLRRKAIFMQSSVDVSPEPNNDRSVEPESKLAGEKKQTSVGSVPPVATTAQPRISPSVINDKKDMALKTDAEKLASCLWRWGWRSFWGQMFFSCLASAALLLSGMMQVRLVLLEVPSAFCQAGKQAKPLRADARF